MLFEERYGSGGGADRKKDIAVILQQLITSFGFDSESDIAVVASPGRDRLFMGHTDSPGLGGATINAATQAEIVSFVQRETASDVVRFSNADSSAFPPFSLPAPLLLHAGAVIDAQLALQLKPATVPATLQGMPTIPSTAEAAAAAASSLPAASPSPRAVAAALLAAAASAGSHGAADDPHSAAMHTLCARRDWQAYSFAALAVMCSAVFPHAAEVRGALKGGAGGLRFHIAALGLPSTGGVSSSAALTGAVSMGLQAALGARWPRPSHAAVDMAEYLLGKTAGAADKTAQLFAARNSAVVVGSFPEQYLRSVSIPAEHVAVFMVQTDTPRITTTAGQQWLQQQLGSQRAAAVHAWGEAVMQSCGATAYELACSDIQAALAQGTLLPALTEAEHDAVCTALFGTTDPAEVAAAPGPLLRELAAGGALAAAMPDTAQRHGIVYRLLGTVAPVVEAAGARHWPRAAALYGVSECERGAVYEGAMQALGGVQGGVDGGSAENALATVLQCVATAHDGDRALWDAWGEGGAGGCPASEQLLLHLPGVVEGGGGGLIPLESGPRGPTVVPPARWRRHT